MYYEMFGRSIGSLNVYVRQNIGGSLRKIWSRSGNVGDFYERADIPVSNAKPFQVMTCFKMIYTFANLFWKSKDSKV